jgi:hypothetical protein
MATAMHNLREWRDRALDRRDHDRLPTSDTSEQHPLASPSSASSEEQQEQVVPEDAHHDSNNNNDEDDETRAIVNVTSSEDSDEDDEGVMEEVDIERQDDATTINSRRNTNSNTNNRATTTTATTTTSTGRRTMSIRDLEEERELARRRTSACIMLAMFILFRLWIQALATGDLGLLLLCLVGSSWTARFMRHTREREEELDRLIQEYVENNNADGNNNNGEGGVRRRDIQRLSFQAQLAFAIMESQREMMNGGYGNHDQHGGQGVSDEAKEHWNRFHWKNAEASNVGYGSVQEDDKLKSGKEEDEPHCSICLVEYEENEELCALPCKHIYHEDCISGWTQNHTRCPLCNFDLESVLEDAPESV